MSCIPSSMCMAGKSSTRGGCRYQPYANMLRLTGAYTRATHHAGQHTSTGMTEKSSARGACDTLGTPVRHMLIHTGAKTHAPRTHLHGHDREVLHAWCVRHAERVPHHGVGTQQACVLWIAGASRQSIMDRYVLCTWKQRMQGVPPNGVGT